MRRCEDVKIGKCEDEKCEDEKGRCEEEKM